MLEQKFKLLKIIFNISIMKKVFVMIFFLSGCFVSNNSQENVNDWRYHNHKKCADFHSDCNCDIHNCCVVDYFISFPNSKYIQRHDKVKLKKKYLINSFK